MGLRIKQWPVAIMKRTTIFVAALALVTQPMYGLVSSQVASASAGNSVVINEIKPSSVGGNERWIELYNPTDSTVDMDNWRIVRGSGTFASVNYFDDASIAPKGYFVVESTDSTLPLDSSLAVALHSGSGDSSEVEVDEVAYPALQEGESYGRSTDGGSNWTVFANPTKADSNAAEDLPVAVSGEFTNSTATYRQADNYDGIAVDVRFKEVAELTGLLVVVERENGGAVEKIAKQSLVEYINSRNREPGSVTAPIVVAAKTYDEAGSGSWNMPKNTTWNASTAPTNIRVVMKFSDDSSKEQTIAVEGGNASYTAIVPRENDTTPPSAPRITSPSARQYFSGSSTKNSWTAPEDLSGISKYQVRYEFPESQAVYRETTKTSRTQTFSGNYQGAITISVRAQDGAGNWSEYSAPITYNYDSVAPATTINVPSGATGGVFTVSGEATDNLSLNRVYVQLVNRDNGKRYGGTTINLVGKGEKASWSREYNTGEIDLPEGSYAAHVSVVDMAGSAGSAGWTENFTLDSTKPTITVKDDYIGNKDGDVFSEVSFRLNDDNALAKYRVNSWEHEVPATPQRHANFDLIKKHLKEGENTITVYDTAGNQSSYVFSYDSQAPSITPKSDAKGNVQARIFSRISLKLHDTESVDKYELNGVTRDVTNDPWSDANFQNIKSLLQEGVNTIVLYDVAGNRVIYDFTYDSIAPVIDESTDAGATVGGEKAFTITQAEENPERMYVELMRREYSETKQEWEWKKLAGKEAKNSNTVTLKVDTLQWSDEGEYQVKVSTHDRAGNSSGYNFSISIENGSATQAVPLLTLDERTEDDREVSGTINSKNAVFRILSGEDAIETSVEFEETANKNGTFNWSFNFPETLSGEGEVKIAASLNGETYSEPKIAVYSFQEVQQPPQEVRGERVTSGGDGAQRELGISPEIVRNLTQPFSAPVSAATRNVSATIFDGTTDIPLNESEGVLGAQSDDNNTTSSGTTPFTNVAAVPSSEGWQIFGVAWFWWLAVAGVFSAALWWLAARGRKSEEQYI